MAAWNHPMVASDHLPDGGVIETSRMKVWEHSHYTGSTDLIFKSHLFPPSVKTLEEPKDVIRLISWGVSTWPGTGSQIEAGLVLPWIKLPIEVRGFFELQAGLGTDTTYDESEFSLGLSYFNSYFQRVSWYSTLSWIRNPVVTGAGFTIAGGPSLILRFFKNFNINCLPQFRSFVVLRVVPLLPTTQPPAFSPSAISLCCKLEIT